MKRLAAAFLTALLFLMTCFSPAWAQGSSAPSGQPTYPAKPTAAPSGQPTYPAKVTATPTAEPTATPTPEPTEEPMTDLTSGSGGIWVTRLQTRLTELGFLNDTIDGKFGYNTAQAVKSLESALYALEEQQIAQMIEAMATPEPTPSPTPTPVPSETPENTAQPTATPLPTASPTPQPTPQTVVDGIAETALLEMILNEDFALYLEDVEYGEVSETARRVQTRLNTLNYLSSLPDGNFGVNSVTALTVFQQENGLSATGIADEQTQKLLFSDSAVAADRPVYNQLSQGVTSDLVKAAQRQLIVMGFMNGSASGYYNENTVQGVKRLQEYLHKLDLDAQPTPEPTPQPTMAPTVDPNSSVVPAPPTRIPQPTATPEVDDGYEGDGILSHDLQVLLFEEGVQLVRQPLQKGDSGSEVERLQRRLRSLEYLSAGEIDGIYGGGTQRAIERFQSRNSLPVTGQADTITQSILYSEDAIRSLKPYRIEVSTSKQRVYVYALDENDNYSILTKTMVCSTGLDDTPTPTGEFTNTGPGARWHYFKKFECWAQYAYYIDGDIMFHSVLYDEDDESTLRKGSVNALGSKASHGCVRLSVEDAKWLYNNCSSGTHVIVY